MPASLGVVASHYVRMLPAYLTPTVGTVTTPDTPDLTIDGDVRVTTRVRRATGTGFPTIAGQDRAGQRAWILTRWITGGDYLVWDQLSGDTQTMQAGVPVVNDLDQDITWKVDVQRTVVGQTDVQFVRDGVGIGGQIAPSVVGGESNAPLEVGSHYGGVHVWQGRIYWAQMEAINRARLQFPGYAGNYLSTPDAANLDITGDIEIVARVSLPLTQAGVIVAKHAGSGSRSFYLSHGTTGQLSFIVSVDGVAQLSLNASAVLTANTPLWIKATRAQSTGVMTIYSAADQPTEPTTWTQRAQGTQAAGQPIFASAADVLIGQLSGGPSPLNGRIARVIVRNGIAGTAVLDVSENNAGTMATATTFVATTGQTVTVNSTGTVAFLDPVVGTVTTPDTADLSIDGDVRLTAKVRDDSAEAAVVRQVVDKHGSQTQGNYTWRLASYNANLAWNGFPTGQSAPTYGVAAARTLWGITPPGIDRFVRATTVGTTATAQRSDDDGATWQTLATSTVPANTYQYRNANPVRIGKDWQGRVYWAQMEAINRVTFQFPGVAGNYLSTPDAANLRITGDIEMIARVAAIDWTPAATTPTIASRWGGVGDNRSYLLQILNNGRMWFMFTQNGINAIGTQSSVAVGAADGTMRWVKVTRTALTGAINFYTAADQATEPTTWTQLGTTQTSTAGIIYAGAAAAAIGGRDTSGSDPWSGRIARTVVRNAIGIDKPQFRFPGLAGNYLSVPHAANLNLTGDFEIVVRAGYHATAGTLYSKDGSPRSLVFGHNAGKQIFCTIPVATAVGGGLSATISALVSGDVYWFKVTRNATTGLVSFYWAVDAPTEPTTWTAAGTLPGIAGPMDVSTSPAQIATYLNTAQPKTGRIARVIVRNGIAGTTVLDVDEVNAPVAGVTSFTATTGQTVTVNERPPATFVFPGVIGNYLSMPGTSVDVLSGDLTFIWNGAADWTKDYQSLIARRGSDPNNSFDVLLLSNAGRTPVLQFYAYGDGTIANRRIITSAAYPAQVDGVATWMAMTYDADNGASGTTTRFWRSTDGAAWTQVGTDVVTAGAFPLKVGTGQSVVIGQLPGAFQFAGRMRRVTINNGIGAVGVPGGTTVLDVNQDNATIGATSFAATTGGTVTVDQTAGNTICQRDATTPWNTIVQGTVLDVAENNARPGDATFPATTGQTVTVNQTVVAGPPHLNPAIGKATTPDPGPTPNFYTLIVKVDPAETAVDFGIVKGDDLGNDNQEFQGWFTRYLSGPKRFEMRGGPYDLDYGFNERVASIPEDTTTYAYFAQSVTCQPGWPLKMEVRASNDGVTWTAPITSSITYDATYHPDNTSPIVVGFSGFNGGAKGKIFWAEMRDGLDPTTGAVLWRFDAAEYPGTGTSYTDPRGRTWTLTNAAAITSSGPILRPAADTTVWRFDASEYTGTGTSFVDPRGRTWTMSAAGAITPPVQIVQPQPDSLTWRFDANEAARGSTWLVPTVGTVTTPDPGPLPNECTFVFKVQGKNGTIVGAWEVTGEYLLRRDYENGVYWFSTWDGVAGGTQWAYITQPMILDGYVAVSVSQTTGNLQSWHSSDGTTWTGMPVKAWPPFTVLNSTDLLRIGGYAAGGPAANWDGRIYSVELRTGLDPEAGTVLWRFDANDYPGTGTSYVDPRGRTWTLTSAAAIPPKSTTTYIDPRGREWTLSAAGAVTPPAPG